MAITFETLKFNNLAQGRLCLSAKRQSAVRPQILKSSNPQVLKPPFPISAATPIDQRYFVGD